MVITGTLNIGGTDTTKVNAFLSAFPNLRRIGGALLTDKASVAGKLTSLKYIGNLYIYQDVPVNTDTVGNLWIDRDLSTFGGKSPTLVVSKGLDIRRNTGTAVTGTQNIRFARGIKVVIFAATVKVETFPSLYLSDSIGDIHIERSYVYTLEFMSNVVKLNRFTLKGGAVLGWNGLQNLQYASKFEFGPSNTILPDDQPVFNSLIELDDLLLLEISHNSFKMFPSLQRLKFLLSSGSRTLHSLQGFAPGFTMQTGYVDIVSREVDSLDIDVPWVCSVIQTLGDRSFDVWDKTGPINYKISQNCDKLFPGKSPKGRAFTDNNCNGIFDLDDTPILRPRMRISSPSNASFSPYSIVGSFEGDYWINGLTKDSAYKITAESRPLTTIYPSDQSYIHSIPAPSLGDFAYCPIAPLDSLLLLNIYPRYLIRNRRNTERLLLSNYSNATGQIGVTVNYRSGALQLPGTFYQSDSSRTGVWRRTLYPTYSFKQSYEVQIDSGYAIRDTISRCTQYTWTRDSDTKIDRTECEAYEVYGFDGPNQLQGKVMSSNGTSPASIRYTIAADNLVVSSGKKVRITDQLPAGLDPASLRILNQDLRLQFSQNGSTLIWEADSLDIANYQSEEMPAGMLIEFEIDVLPGLNAQSWLIRNQMEIDFDGQSVMSTESIFSGTNAVNGIEFETPFTISPNPAHNRLLVDIDHRALTLPVPYLLTDALGRKLETGMLYQERSELQVDQLTSGFYILQVGQAIRRFIKE